MKKDSITRKMKFYEYTTHIRNVTIKIFAQENVAWLDVMQTVFYNFVFHSILPFLFILEFSIPSQLVTYSDKLLSFSALYFITFYHLLSSWNSAYRSCRLSVTNWLIKRQVRKVLYSVYNLLTYILSFDIVGIFGYDNPVV